MKARAGVLVAGLAIVGASLPARASTVDLVPARAAAAASAVNRSVDAVRAHFHGGFASAIAALGGAQAQRGHAEPRRAAAARTDLAASIARLDAAVRAATALVGPYRADDARLAVGSALGSLSNFGDELARLAHNGKAADTPARRPAPFSYSLPSLRAAIARAPEAAALIGRALDASVPRLRALASAMPPVDATVDGCDLVDRLPDLCVGSTANNVYTKDARLLVDLGGDDVYRNGAGSAPFVVSNTAAAPVSVNVDLGGNDTYIAPVVAGFTTPQSNLIGTTDFIRYTGRVGQGVGIGGSVGVLVDTAGNDTYTADASTADGAGRGIVIAQGAGTQGIGALFDFGGDDRYAARTIDGGPASSIAAQAVGSGPCYAGSVAIGAVVACDAGLGGLLVDSGQGSDEYLIDQGTVHPEGLTKSTPVYRVSIGQAATIAAVAVLADDGGTDGFDVVAQSDVVDARLAPTLATLAQGESGVGRGFLLEGQGNTHYRAALRGTGPVFWSLLEAQATAYSQGTGVIDDVGGSDTYESIVATADRGSAAVDDDCECEDGIVTEGRRGIAWFVAQGATWNAGGVAAIHDHAGDDSYVASMGLTREAAVTDRRAGTNGSPVSYLANGYQTVLITTQGAAIANSTGALLDDAGSDRYDANFESVTAATAPSSLKAIAATFPAGGEIQGSSPGGSAGIFWDGGGTGDVVRARDSNRAVAADGAFSSAVYYPSIQGGGSGGVFVAAGDQPSILSNPSYPTCSESGGARGSGLWRECAPGGGQHVSAGYAPHAASAPATLQFVGSYEAPADENLAVYPDPKTVHVGARVTDAAGSPVAGGDVHFLLEQVDNSRLYWNVDAVTDADGIARADLPLLGTGNGAPFAVLALFDGRAGALPLLPANATQALTLD
jgi:hypothetical protein